MNNYLGIDYGKAKIGLAVSSGSLASPLKVIHYKNIEEAFDRIKKTTQEEKIEKLVVGVSDGEVGIESKKFGKKLSEKLNIPVVFEDETLTTLDVQQKSIEAGIKRKKRKNMEDAFSATLILQNYLDSL